MSPGARPPAKAELLDAYGIEVDEFRGHPFGFDGECWIADQRWFVKVWRHQPPASLAVLEHLDLPVVVPLRTRNGELVARSGRGSYAVFPYVVGRAATWDDWEEMARAMRMVHQHPLAGLELPRVVWDEPAIESLRVRLDHPWIRDRRDEVVRMVDHLEAVIDRARRIDRPAVLCHTDLIGDNLLIGDDGRLVALLDWDHARLGRREHDVWIATEGPQARRFLDAYGAAELDPTHLEYALVRRAVEGLAARVEQEVDRPGIDTWGFDR